MLPALNRPVDNVRVLQDREDIDPASAQTANMGHQLAGGNSS